MDEQQFRRYLESAAALHGLALDDEQLARVAIVLGRIAAIAVNAQFRKIGSVIQLSDATAATKTRDYAA